MGTLQNKTGWKKIKQLDWTGQQNWTVKKWKSWQKFCRFWYTWIIIINNSKDLNYAKFGITKNYEKNLRVLKMFLFQSQEIKAWTSKNNA